MAVIEREVARVQDHEIAAVKQRLDAVEILVHGGKSTLAITKVTSRGPDLRPLEYSVDKREIFDFENRVFTRREIQAFERKYDALQQEFRTLVNGLGAIVSAAETAIVQARGADAIAMQAMGALTVLCSALGIDLDVVDGQICLSHVAADVKALALAGKVDRLKGDLEFRIRAEAGRLREEMQQLTERANGTGG
jgi:hypothetical protein